MIVSNPPNPAEQQSTDSTGTPPPKLTGKPKPTDFSADAQLKRAIMAFPDLQIDVGDTFVVNGNNWMDVQQILEISPPPSEFAVGFELARQDSLNVILYREPDGDPDDPTFSRIRLKSWTYLLVPEIVPL